jgi:hypothetical protein
MAHQNTRRGAVGCGVEWNWLSLKRDLGEWEHVQHPSAVEALRCCCEVK